MEWTPLALTSYYVLWTLVVLQVILTLALARLVGQLHRRLPPSGARVIDPGPEIGQLMEDWQGTDVLGNPLGFRFPRERGLFLLYLSPHCSSCDALLPSAKRFFKEVASEADGLWVMVVGSTEVQIDYAHRKGLNSHPVIAEAQLPSAWRLNGAPFGVWVNAAGQVQAKGMVNHREHLESLRHAAIAGHASIQSYFEAQTEREEQERESAVQVAGEETRGRTE